MSWFMCRASFVVLIVSCCGLAHAAATRTAEFQAKIDAAWRSGGGRVVVPAGEWTVGTLWPNRLIGDARLPVSERKTETAWPHWKASDKPLASGLHGPVRLVVRRLIEQKEMKEDWK